MFEGLDDEASKKLINSSSKWSVLERVLEGLDLIASANPFLFHLKLHVSVRSVLEGVLVFASEICLFVAGFLIRNPNMVESHVLCLSYLSYHLKKVPHTGPRTRR